MCQWHITRVEGVLRCLSTRLRIKFPLSMKNCAAAAFQASSSSSFHRAARAWFRLVSERASELGDAAGVHRAFAEGHSRGKQQQYKLVLLSNPFRNSSHSFRCTRCTLLTPSLKRCNWLSLTYHQQKASCCPLSPKRTPASPALPFAPQSLLTLLFRYTHHLSRLHSLMPRILMLVLEHQTL